MNVFRFFHLLAVLVAPSSLYFDDIFVPVDQNGLSKKTSEFVLESLTSTRLDSTYTFATSVPDQNMMQIWIFNSSKNIPFNYLG